MSSPPKLDVFVDKIMHIQVLRMGGAFTGIMGSSGADSDVLNSLKKSVMAFADEYSKPNSGHNDLTRLSQEIWGYTQTLQLTSTLSAKETNELIDDLEVLMDKLSD
jgi:hypothetical protein